ncbi:sulfatase-like hydrolase/transferase [Sinomicrobium sp. M5D2P9]
MAQNKNKESPNILIFIADDAGWNDVGYRGSGIHTPNIDRLEKKGVRLDRFYTAPTCSPSRASLLTGMPASRMGIVAPISGKSELKLPDSIATLPRILKKQGYQTALFGKWHLGLKPESGPENYGFDYSYGFLHGQIDQYTHYYKNGDQSWHRNGTFISEQGHTTDLITKDAMDWLSSKRDSTKNFYIQIAYSAPHFPLQEPAEWKKPYQNTFKNDSRKDYAAAMSHMDHAMGIILEALNKKGLDDNTLILFISDNGAMENWYPTDQYNGRFGPCPELGDNYPLRDWKTSNYEGAVRVPAIIYWKGHLNPGTNNSYLSVTDIMPTLISLTNNNDLPTTVEGKNIWQAIRNNKPIPGRQIYIRGHLQESLTQKPWKIVRTRHKNTPDDLELYNVEDDPEEERDVIDLYQTIAERMTSALVRQFERDAKKVNLDIPD